MDTSAVRGARVASEPFELERFFAKHEFHARHLLCCSDCESCNMGELISLHADDQDKAMWSELRLGYTETMGLPALRQEVAALYQTDAVTAENVLFFAGAEEAIFCLLRTLLTPADHCIVLVPCYQSLLSVAEEICEVSRLPLLPSSGWAIDFERLERLVQPGRTKAVVTNFPHNPTGAALTADDQQRLVTLAQQHGMHLVCDEVYRGLERTPYGALPTAEACATGVSIGGLSKSYGLAGLRIGWVASPDRALVAATADNKHYLSICNSAPSEALGLIAVKARAALWRRNLDLVRANLDLMRAFMARHPDRFSWEEPTGGCCGFLRLHGVEGDLAARCDRLVEERGVLLLPGRHFPATDELVEPGKTHRQVVSEHVRIGLGRRSFPAALEALEANLDVLFD